MKKTIFNLLLLSVIVFIASCGDKKATGPGMAPPENSATVTQTYTITLTMTPYQSSTITATRTITLTNTDTPTYTVTPTKTATSTSTVTPTNTPKTFNLIPGNNLGCADADILNLSPTNNTGSCGGISIYADPSSGYTKRILLRYGVASAFITPTVVAVNLKMKLNAYANRNGNINVHKMNAPWVEGKFCDASSTTTVSWSGSGTSAWTTAGGDYDSGIQASFPFDSYTGTDSVIRIPLPISVFQGWLANDATNYGLLLKLANENPADSTGISFYAAGVGSSNNPTLEVLYY